MSNYSRSDLIAESRRVIRFAALLFLFTLLQGFYYAAVLLGHIEAEARVVASSHVSAFLAIGVLGAYAWSLPELKYNRIQIWWLSNAFILGLYANWFGNFMRAHFFVSALEPKGGITNILFFSFFNLLIALPSLIAAIGWIWGLRGNSKNDG